MLDSGTHEGMSCIGGCLLSKTTVIDNDFATLWYYPEDKIVHHQFHRFMYGQAFRDVIMKGADLFEQHGCNKWLSDDRGNPVLNPADKTWGDQHWQPRVLAAGWKYWGLVLPEKVLGQLSMERLAGEYRKLGVEVQTFSDPDEALKWLRSKH